MNLNETALIFDLDDTLFAEVNYLFSAFEEIAGMTAPATGLDAGDLYRVLTDAHRRGDNAFDALTGHIASRGLTPPLTPGEMVAIYRRHKPAIRLAEGVEETLTRLKAGGAFMGIITDGRIGTQTAKIEALGLPRYFEREHILISEATGHDKLSRDAFEMMQAMAPEGAEMVYIGDNPAKDFLWPRRLGWLTVMLRDRGENIHRQVMRADGEGCPEITIDDLCELPDVLTQRAGRGLS